MDTTSAPDVDWQRAMNGDFPPPATGLRDYLVDAAVAYQRFDHDSEDLDRDFDVAQAVEAAGRLLDRGLGA